MKSEAGSILTFHDESHLNFCIPAFDVGRLTYKGTAILAQSTKQAWLAVPF